MGRGKRLFVFVFSFMFAQGAHALFTESMVSPHALYQKPKNFNKIVNATHLIQYGCTGSFVSNQGHMITALHCLEFFFPKHVEEGAYKPSPRRWEYFFGREDSYWPGNHVYPGPLKEFLLNGKNLDAEVVFTGERYGVNYLDNMTAQDFALIKVDVDEQVDCIKTPSRSVRQREELWALGYPAGYIERYGNEVGDGQSLKVSTGKVDFTLAQSLGHMIDFLTDNTERDFQDVFADVAEYQKTTYLAMVDVDEGMSGGPLVNREGKLMGIVSMAMPAHFSKLERKVSIVDVLSAKRIMGQFLDHQEIAEIFSCR